MASEEDDELTEKCEDLKLDISSRSPIRANHRARNITNEFNKASRALAVGQLVKDETFSLFDSVQALEIMDPKMDTGFLKPGETLDDEYDVCRDLSPEEVLWIMDQLLCYEMAWHQGYPLAQNVVTSMYIYNLLTQDRLPEALPYFRPLDGTSKEAGPLVQNVLRTFCIGVIKTCDIVIELVQSQQYYEEEDFNTHTFGLSLLTDIPDNEFFKLNEEAIDWLNHAEHHKVISQNMCGALLSRLICRELFMTLILPNPNPNHCYFPGSENFHNVIEAIKSNNTKDCRKPVEEAFSGKLQRRLASTVPPRPVIILDIETACLQLSKMFEDVREATKTDALASDMPLEELSFMLWAFSAREPLAFPRAVLQMFLFNEGKFAGPGDGIRRLLITHIRKCLVDPEALHNSFWDVETPSDPRFQIARSVDFFVEQAAPEYINVLRSICQNRCRIRRCLTNVAKDIDNLASDFSRFMKENKPHPSKIATSLNQSIRDEVQSRLYKCIRLLLLQVCEWIIELGFEQDLYQQSEIPILAYYLTSVRAEIKNIFSDFMKRLSGNSIIGKSKWKDMLDERCRYSSICENLWKIIDSMFSVLDLLGTTMPAHRPYSPQSTQIELRMRPFMALSHGTSIDFSAHSSISPVAVVDLPKMLDWWSEQVASMRTAVRQEIQGNKMETSVENIDDWPVVYAHEVFKSMLKACVKIAISTQALKKALETVEGKPHMLVGKVSFTLEKSTLGYRWPVPSIVVPAEK